ncbi:MAG TPA: tRNA (N6-threonylcarbamoyladenosine(37)-N6)-methyltransferase TrmO [Planctomycetota bacterium]|nr:tRNA (N6-threonylcarbamoyladenosine(37)-N6)-methyltransferase TrmO [Planctomycetota bacterium]
MPLTLEPIGVIHTPWQDRGRAPRQPGVGPVVAEGTIVLNPHCNFEPALADLAGFDRIWVLFWFHLNRGWKPKVLPPRSIGRKKRGVFATRSPHRPNPIGLSLLKLVAIKGRTLHVEGVDILDGSPILDIKPYLPYAEAFPDARIGWLEEVAAAEKILGQKDGAFHVVWSDFAREQAAFLSTHGVELTLPTNEALKRDPTPHPYRRITVAREGFLQLAIKSWRVRFSVEKETVLVEKIMSGYSCAALEKRSPENPLHDEAAHVAFHQYWPPPRRKSDKHKTN